MPDRYYLTTAIAYANNKPGLHTLYEVIGADVDRALAPDEGRRHAVPDRHRRALDQHRPARGRRGPRRRSEFVDEKVALFKDGRGRAGDRARPVHPDDRSRPRPGGPGDGPPGARERRHLPRHVRGLVLPERGLPQRDRRPVETARGTICPNHPDVPLQWLTERNWFFRLSAYQERLERHFADHPDFVQPDYRRNEMLGFIRGGPRGLLDQPRADPGTGASRSRSPRTARRRSARTARGTPRPA